MTPTSTLYKSMSHLYLRRCYGGELFSEIEQKKELTEADACLVFKQIASALVYLHNFNMCHGDLKPENIMLKNPADFTAIKLIDFGYSRKISSNQQGVPIGTV